MSVALVRVDQRLAHGQIITSWTKYLTVSHIVIVDDAIAKDEFMYQVLVMSAPSGIKIDVVSVEQAVANYPHYEQAHEQVMLLFKNIENVSKFINLGVPVKEVNVGNIGAGPQRKSISKNVSLTPKEIEQVRALAQSGVYVYLQMLYTDSKIDITKVL